MLIILKIYLKSNTFDYTSTSVYVIQYNNHNMSYNHYLYLPIKNQYIFKYK